MSPFIKKIPNILTIMRVVLIPFFVLLMEIESDFSIFLALIVFIIAAVTDFADGVIARNFSAITDFGKLLDPVADKILVMAALVTLVSHVDPISGSSIVPAWIVILILARETWITGLRLIGVKDGLVVPADKLGKIKASMQMLAIVMLLINSCSVKFSLGFSEGGAYQIGIILLLISIVFSYISAYSYTSTILNKTKFS